MSIFETPVARPRVRVVATWILALACANAAGCGSASSPSSEGAASTSEAIHGGAPAPRGSFPANGYLASISGGQIAHIKAASTMDTDVVCGATLIGHDVALTAAHCACANTLSLELGWLSVGFGNTGSSPTIGVTAILVHPTYNRNLIFANDDIAVVHLAADPGIAPANIGAPVVGQQYTLLGYGTDDRGLIGVRKILNMLVTSTTRTEVDAVSLSGTLDGGDSGSGFMSDPNTVVGVVNTGLSFARPDGYLDFVSAARGCLDQSCVNAALGFVSADPCRQAALPAQCAKEGEACGSCCAGLSCDDGVCSSPSACAAEGEPASAGCCSGLVDNDGLCTEPLSCADENERCTTNVDCCSDLICDDGSCETPPDPCASCPSSCCGDACCGGGGPSCMDDGYGCAADSDCCNGTCEGGVCGATEFSEAPEGGSIVCGNNTCEIGETCKSCPHDCGTCAPSGPVCGNHACETGETCTNCPQDCGSCAPPGPVCGNHVCEAGETCTNCPWDCGTCPLSSPLSITSATFTSVGGPVATGTLTGTFAASGNQVNVSCSSGGSPSPFAASITFQNTTGIFFNFPGAYGPGSSYACQVSVAAGGSSSAPVALVTTDPTQGKQGMVGWAYSTFLKRAPDIGGYEFYLFGLNAGSSPVGVLETMIGSSEFLGEHASESDATYLTWLYQHVLNDAVPDPSGYAWWLSQLSSGTSRSAVADAFVTSPEFQGKYPMFNH